MSDRKIGSFESLSGLCLASWSIYGTLEGIPAIVAAVIAAVMLLTGLFARCPFYKMIDVDTSIQEQPYSTTDDRSGL